MAMIEWAMWANEQAVLSAFVIIFGGILGVSGMFAGWEIGIYALVAGVLILMIEYPRGKRSKGRTTERKGQQPLTKLLSHLGFFTHNYFVRFLIHLVLSVPLCFILATIMGGLSLFVGSIIYLVAAFKGEKWEPCLPESDQSGNTKELKSFRQPKKPPPRAPPVASNGDNRI